MKKYIKPAIEEIKLGVYTPIAQSEISAPDITVGNTQGSSSYTFAPGKKGSYEEEDDEEYFGW